MGVKGDFLSKEMKAVLIAVNAFHTIFGLMVIVDLSWLIHALVHTVPSKTAHGGFSDEHLLAYLIMGDTSGIVDAIFYWFLDKFQYQPHGFIVIAEERATHEKDIVLAAREAHAKENLDVVKTLYPKKKSLITREHLVGAFRRSVNLTAAIAICLQKIGVRVLMSFGETDHQVTLVVSNLLCKRCLLSFVNLIGCRMYSTGRWRHYYGQ